LRISQSGDGLGLPATITRKPYELTAEVIEPTLIHEEIAQIIDASRETVTRLFSDFKSKRLVEVKGSTVTIKNQPALESLVGA
jgi:CRP-like cAMP-binding protein